MLPITLAFWMCFPWRFLSCFLSFSCIVIYLLVEHWCFNFIIKKQKQKQKRKEKKRVLNPLHGSMVIMGVFICKQLVHSCRSSAPKIRGHCSCVCNLKSELVTESKIINVQVPFTNNGSSTYNSVTSNTHIRTSQTRSGSNYPWLGVKVTCTLCSNDILTCQKDMILLCHCSPSNRMMSVSVILKNFACRCMYVGSASRTANYCITFYHNFNLAL